MTSRAWLFTDFNEVEDVSNFFNDESSNKIQYAIWQQEKCPKTGKLHIQGYLELKSPCRRKQVQETILASNAHLEIRAGTPEQAINYCSKLETRVDGPYEYGQHKGQGKRSDIDRVVDDIKLGYRIDDIVQKHTRAFVRMHKGIMATYAFLNKPIEDREVKVLVLHGKTGCGKTRCAMSGNRDDIYKMDLDDDQSKIWFDGYIGQKTLVLDEFYGHSKPAFMLKLLDRYPLQVPIKGGMVNAQWDRVIITSNVHPDKWYEKWYGLHKNVKEAFMRRLTHIEEITKDNHSTIKLKYPEFFDESIRAQKYIAHTKTCSQEGEAESQGDEASTVEDGELDSENVLSDAEYDSEGDLEPDEIDQTLDSI